MHTLLIRIEHPPTGERLVVRGYHVRHGDLGWYEDFGAEKELPRNLPTVTANGRTQQFEDAAREAMLSAGDPLLPTREVGRRLWSLISDGAVGAWWSQQIEDAGDAGARTILDVRPPELKCLPWELMTSDRGGPVFRDDRHPWVRACAPWSTLEELLVPVRMLVVVGDRTSPDLRVDDELDAIHSCVRDVPGSWHVDIVVAPDLRILRKRYKDVEPHILHVIGHATLRGDRYVLAMTLDERRQWAFAVEDVAELPLPAPRLVVLNCCRTSTAAAPSASAWTFTDAFVNLRSAAVVTMQGDIPSSASIAFTSTFYRELISCEPIDVAAARARLEIETEMREHDDERSWALPSLYVATDPDRVLPVRSRISPAQLEMPPYDSAFSEVPNFLDRSMERRTLLRSLDPEPHSHARPLLLLAGEQQMGRSAIVRSTFLTLRLRGRNAVYVHLDAAVRDRKLSWLAVLRIIRDELWEWISTAPREARLRFDHELAYFKEHRDPEPFSPTRYRMDDGAEFPSEGEHYREWIEKTLAAFCRMLVGAARDEPLLLALDSLRAIHGDDVRDVLAEHLLLRIAEGMPREDVHGVVRCLVTGSEDEIGVIPEPTRRRLGPLLPIEPFDQKDVPQLIREYLARRALAPTERWTQNVEYILTNAPRTAWKPGELSQLLRSLEPTLRQ
jgi:hypothetical protein